jgi:ferredoxin
MIIKEIYEKFDAIGCLTFSTMNGKYIESRIAHFIAYDDEGLYFGTMNTKPFYKQLTESKVLSVSGMYPKTYVEHDKNNLPYFAPGYTMRISGDIREITLEELKEKAKTNDGFNVAVHDIVKYPATKIFVLNRAWGECFDFDFEMENRDNKIERERFTYGGMEVEPAGLTITDKCISCGKCAEVCTFKAIKPGTPYEIIGNRCDECGNCFEACPVKAIIAKGGVERE